MCLRRLGRSPLVVSELSFGTWLTVPGGIERKQAIRFIHAAVDHGIPLFDTANQYGASEAERALGEALKSYPRDRYLVVAKLFFPVGDETDLGLTMAQMALAWVLRRSEVASAIIGASRAEQIADDVRAVGVTLPAEAIKAIDHAVSAVAIWS